MARLVVYGPACIVECSVLQRERYRIGVQKYMCKRSFMAEVAHSLKLAFVCCETKYQSQKKSDIHSELISVNLFKYTKFESNKRSK